MNKKSGVKGKLKIVMIVILSVLVVAVVVLCAKKIKRIQNEKNIIGTWKKSSSEEVITFRDNGTLTVHQDMPDAGLSCGDAAYYFGYTDTICVTQGDSSVEFGVEVEQNELTILFMGQEYLVLQKQ